MTIYRHRRRDEARQRRHRRVRRRLSGTAERPRLIVHRSHKNIGAQVVDDIDGKTLLGVTSQGIEARGSKVDQARETGRRLAELARERGITRVVFDRGGYLYHGRVQALAEGAREGGLEF
jgi:large subunit ribosomal protein L18